MAGADRGRVAEADRGVRRSALARCHHPRRRVTQYSRDPIEDTEQAAAYWMPPLARGMTPRGDTPRRLITPSRYLPPPPARSAPRSPPPPVAAPGRSSSRRRASEIDEDRGRQRQRRGEVAAEIGAELRHQRADALLQEAHRAGGGAGGFGADADSAGRASSPSRRRWRPSRSSGCRTARAGAWLQPVKLQTRFSRLPPTCSASPNQISFSSEWRGAKRTQNRLPTR